MSEFLSLTEVELIQRNARWTALEISQQPRIWQQTAEQIKIDQSALSAWLEPILSKASLRIILTGAGTSAYIGKTLAPHLTAVQQRLFEAISTTDIVSSPAEYLLPRVPTLLISYGRSGNSPESIAAVDLANQLVEECYHLIITCNPDGVLSRRGVEEKNSHVLLMPEGTHDQSFAMTSSFSSMYVATLAIFAPSSEQLVLASSWAKDLLEKKIEDIKAHAASSSARMVFLGSGSLVGIAQEASLKFLELTAGKTMATHESSLGFRHGPKSLVDETTDVVVLMSGRAYSRAYDRDMLAELQANGRALSVVALDEKTFERSESLDDVWRALPYIVYCQVLSFFKSLNTGITPDNPSPGGDVNRVVKGVTIYPFSAD